MDAKVLCPLEGCWPYSVPADPYVAAIILYYMRITELDYLRAKPLY